jgi:thiol-disulfide isomerase/thioredoxin
VKGFRYGSQTAHADACILNWFQLNKDEKIMKRNLLTVIIAWALWLPHPGALAADKSNAAAELKTLIAKVKLKLQDGSKTEKALEPELKEFDELLAKHKDEKTDDVAQILMMKAMLYSQVLDNPQKGKALLAQLKKDFPDTEVAASLKKQEAAEKLKESLVEGSKFPDFTEKDLAGKPLSIANYQGKVVLVDFWATWCGPCVRELPNVLATYGKHHDKGFEIIGISLDQDENKLAAFTKDKNMPWPQYFDGKGWGNKLAAKYGVQSIPATYLLDGDGKIIGKDLRGEALEQAVSAALAKK